MGYENDIATLRPMPAPRGEESSSVLPTQLPRVDVAIAIITRGGKVLICQRPPGASFAGYWEFPGGKREQGESIRDCLVREVREELAIDVEPTAALRPVDHDYPRGRIRLHPHLCTPGASDPQLIASQAAKWVDPRDLKSYRFPPANESLIKEAIEYLASQASPVPEQAG